MSRTSRQSSEPSELSPRFVQAGETTSVSLDESWSGSISVGDTVQQSKPSTAFTLSLWSFHTKSNIKGIIFRNRKPIQNVKPAFGVYSTNRDVLRSLKSLDSRLQREYSELSTGASSSSRATSTTSGHSSFSVIPSSDDFSPTLLRKSFGDPSYAVPHKDTTRQSRANTADHRGFTTPTLYSSLYDVVETDSKISTFKPIRSSSLNRLNNDNELGNRVPQRASSVSSVTSASGTPRGGITNYRISRIGSDDYTRGSFKYINEENEEANPSLYLSQSISGKIYSSRDNLSVNNKEVLPVTVRPAHGRECSDEELLRVGEAVIKLGDGDGQKRNIAFQNVVRRICDVVNVIFSGLPKNLFPFQFERLDDNVHFETKGLRSIEIYVCPLRLKQEDYEVRFFEVETMLADMFVQVERKDIEHFFVEDPVTRRKRLSPCKMMIVFAHVLRVSLKDRNIYSTRSRKKFGYELPHGAEILFSMITERLIQLNLKFPEEVSPYEVTLVLALEMRKFPDCSNIKRSRDWPSYAVKNTIDQEGVHLLAKLGDKNLHSWTVSTLKARRTLLRLTDSSGNKLRVLLAFQTLRETELSRPKLLLPLHLATVLFWACMKFPSSSDWTNEKIGLRFLDLLLALRRCLWRGECRDFFFTFSNLFEDQTPDILHAVASKLDNIIKTPLKYLRRRVMVSDGEGDD